MNVGILGAGFIVPEFIECAKQIDGYHLTGLWGRNAEKIEKYRCDVDYVTTDIEQLLNDESIDTIYIALPNSLHYQYAKMAIEHNKHVIVEKPFCVTLDQAKQLFELGEKHHVLVFEAIVTKYNPCYQKAKEKINELGEIKIVNGNFSQYSRRYDKFKNGIILPAFDKKLAGGALMDLGVYNIHFSVGVFGKPKDVYYYGNIVDGVDTSGIVILDYGSFKASLINGKDCGSESFCYIQGDKGFLKCETTTSRCASFVIHHNDGQQEKIALDSNDEFVGMKYELKEFIRMFKGKDFVKCKEYSIETLEVQEVLEKAFKSANLNYK